MTTRQRRILGALGIVVFALCLIIASVAAIVSNPLTYLSEGNAQIVEPLQATSLDHPALPGTLVRFGWGTLLVPVYSIVSGESNIEQVGPYESAVFLLIRLRCAIPKCSFRGHDAVTLVGKQGIIYYTISQSDLYTESGYVNIARGVDLVEGADITSALFFAVRRDDSDFTLVILDSEKTVYLALKDNDPGYLPTYRAMVNELVSMTPPAK